MLYACDAIWWQRANGAKDFRGLKLSQDKIAKRSFSDVELVEVVRHHDKLLIEKPGVVGWGGNSGFHALNLAVQFGAAKIILVGYDMTLKHGLHWHERHPEGMHNPSDGNVARWRRVTDEAAVFLKELRVTVINASPISALVAYPKMTLREALDYGENRRVENPKTRRTKTKNVGEGNNFSRSEAP